jgi:hypothetical protein
MKWIAPLSLGLVGAVFWGRPVVVTWRLRTQRDSRLISDCLWENPAKVARQNSEKKGQSKKNLFSKDAPLINFIHPKVQKHFQK